MADKTYVEVANIRVTDAFDKKYKSTLPKLMTATIEKAINGSANFTTKPSSDKNATGFYVDGNVISITKTDKGNSAVIDAKVSMQLAEWPKKSMFGFLKGGGQATTGNLKNIDGDVADVVNSVLEDLVKKKAIPALDARAKTKP